MDAGGLRDFQQPKPQKKVELPRGEFHRGLHNARVYEILSHRLGKALINGNGGCDYGMARRIWDGIKKKLDTEEIPRWEV
ncbi:MAG TPA: hypothetical protein VG318_07695 [Actinomycetota bacterium]|nr:hypothetical protein [Actinomycetota bacterium]